jgi:uridine nucleosidase
MYGAITASLIFNIWIGTNKLKDAFAVLLVALCPRFNILGISTVHGNSSLENTTRNTLSVLEAIGRRDIPVYPGAAKPFCREAVHAPSIHGRKALSDYRMVER